MTWDVRFPISGDPKSCKRFKEIINSDISSGARANGVNSELLDLVARKLVVLEAIVEFQNRAVGKYKIEKRKAVITDDALDEIPYGTLSSLLKDDPKSCLKAFEIGVVNYAMTQGHIARYLASGITEGTLSCVPNGSRRCKADNGRVVLLKSNNMVIPHYLGCACSIRPVVKF